MTRFDWENLKNEPVPAIRVHHAGWKNGAWSHVVWWVEPAEIKFPNHFVLELSGDCVPSADLQDAHHMARECGVPVAVVFGIPNQPIEDRREDDLIAHSFEQFFQTGDPNWPVLAPMVQGALACAAAVQEWRGVSNFVIGGGSKRGWTTWLAAAKQPDGLVGIAPRVYENLGMLRQMDHQVELWGDYSPQIDDYTRRGLQMLAILDRGKDLLQLVDPIHHLDKIRVPILCLPGSNDPFWAVDALSLYFDALPKPALCRITPNAGHDLGSRISTYETLGQFVRHLAEEIPLPKFGWDSLEGALRYRIWQAESDSAWFVDSTFKPSEWQETPHFVHPDSRLHKAIFLEAEFPSGITLTTPAKHLKPSQK